MKQTKPPQYTELRDELDTVLARLQSDDLDIDEAVKLYARGTELVGRLQAHLKSAENVITKLKADFEKAPKE